MGLLLVVEGADGSVKKLGRYAASGIAWWPKRPRFLTLPHASWLNMVEIEIGVLRGQCLDRRIGERELLIAEIMAWQQQRNASGTRVRWKFTTQKARDKLGRAYPNIANKS